jgi:lysozyme family protein
MLDQTLVTGSQRYDKTPMPSDEIAPTLEERRLALDELKAQHEYEVSARELDLKRSESGWVSRLFTPLTTTVFAGILTFAASAIGTLIQSHNALDLERQKFEANMRLEQRKEQHELILKMVSVGDEKQARANLRFLAESELIDADLAKRVLAMKDAPVLPSAGGGGPTSARDFQAVRSDDDALGLVLSWEQGFVTNAADPALSTNTGITITALSQYLGHQASIEELKALTPTTIKDYYKRYLAPAAGIESQLVRAAFLNVSVMNGPRRATQVFQEAGQKISGIRILQDGMFGPQSISMINASAAKDPGLVVETANCIVLEQLKTSPAWGKFGPVWSRRFRAFSPVTLHGVCPELPVTASDQAGGDGSGTSTTAR